MRAPHIAWLGLLLLGGCPAPPSRPLDETADPDTADPDTADSDTADPDTADPDSDTAEPPLDWPELPHLDAVVDLARGSAPVWASVISVQEDRGSPAFRAYGYGDTAHRTDFWVASTIKLYTVTAALVLLHEEGLSLDTEATFYRRTPGTGPWVEDLTVSFRQMIFDVFDHSSNSDYTLLLRFAGIDWLSTEFFTAAHGFERTALLVPYVTERPWRYDRAEEQRIVLSDGGRTVERTHLWSGTLYDDQVGCAFRYGTRANCSPPAELAEHMRRLMFHEWLPEAERFDLDPEHLDWLRYGDGRTEVMYLPGSPWADGIRKVFPDADYWHKAGWVSSYALDVHYVEDAQTHTRFAAAVVTESPTSDAYDKVSEELTRMLRTPRTYVHLDWLEDHVNPVTADLWVYTEVPGVLELIVKPYAQDGMDESGWTALPGTSTALGPGEAWIALASGCLGAAVDGQQHVRGRFTPSGGAPVATSDLHYVIVDADLPCP